MNCNNKTIYEAVKQEFVIEDDGLFMLLTDEQKKEYITLLEKKWNQVTDRYLKWWWLEDWKYTDEPHNHKRLMLHFVKHEGLIGKVLVEYSTDLKHYFKLLYFKSLIIH